MATFTGLLGTIYSKLAYFQLGAVSVSIWIVSVSDNLGLSDSLSRRISSGSGLSGLSGLSGRSADR